MTEEFTLYDVFLVRYTGDFDVIASQLAQLFGIAPEQAMLLLQQLPARVKHRVSRDIAARFQAGLAGTGIEVIVKPVGSVPEQNQVGNSRANSPESGSRPPIGASSPIASKILRGGPMRLSGRSVAIAGLMLAAVWTIWQMLFSGMGVLKVHRVGEGKAKPAVILLHGYGAPGDDLVGLAEEAVARVPGIQAVVPEAPHWAGRGLAWWKNDREDAIDSRASVVALIDALVEDGTAPDRIVVAGFSQGAILAVDVGLHYPGDLAGVGMLSGRRQADLGWEERIAERVPMQVFIGHGKRDRRVSFGGARKFAAELKRHGHTVVFVQFDEGHKIPIVVREAFFAFTAQRLAL